MFQKKIVEKTKIHKGAGHRKRLRKRFLESGLSGFLDYEVVELLLTLNTPRKDCKQSAKELLRRFKSLPGVCEADSAELARVNGVGPANIFGIKLIKEVADRYLEKKLIDKKFVRNSKDLKDYLNHFISHKNREVFIGIFLNAKNRVITSEILFKGSLTSSSVYPREVIAKAIENRAAGLIFAHNHPSGDSSPSREDISITKRLVSACRHVGIIVHEHVITGEDVFYSFADNGFIEKFNREFENENAQ